MSQTVFPSCVAGLRWGMLSRLILGLHISSNEMLMAASRSLDLSTHMLNIQLHRLWSCFWFTLLWVIILSMAIQTGMVSWWHVTLPLLNPAIKLKSNTTLIKTIHKARVWTLPVKDWGNSYIQPFKLIHEVRHVHMGTNGGMMASAFAGVKRQSPMMDQRDRYVSEMS